MADETTADRPLSNLTLVEKNIDQAAEPDTGAKRLRTFEDDVFGPDVTRINGQVERGVGSRYARMDDDQKRRYAALERLVQTESDLAKASVDLEDAKAKHVAAVAAVEGVKDAAAK